MFRNRVSAQVNVYREILLALPLCAMSVPSLAIEPASVQVGMFELVPSFAIEQRYDSNIYSQADNEQESWVTVLSPSFQVGLDMGSLALELGYLHSTGLYENSNDDNYEDNRLSLNAEWELNHRNQFDFEYLFNDGHEDRGTGYSQGDAAGLIDEPNTFEDETFALSYTLGGEQSQGRLRLNLKDYSREYTDDASFTRDRDEVGGGAAFFWRVGGRTELLAEVNTSDIEYDEDVDDVIGTQDILDSTATTYLLGVTWEGSGKTEGSIKVGQAEKNFDDDDREDFSGFSWDVGIKWSPKEYSVFSLNSSRDEQEINTGSGSYIDYKFINVSWQQGWTDRVSSNVYFQMADETYEGNVDERSDEVSTYGLRIDYSMLRWLELGLSLADIQRDSNVGEYEFDRQQVAFHFQVSL